MNESIIPKTPLTADERKQLDTQLALLIRILDNAGETLASAHLCQARETLTPTA